jgi:hypothetical protein
MSQADTDVQTDNVRQFPGATPESQPHPKADPTSALRSKRYRRSRKQVVHKVVSYLRYWGRACRTAAIAVFDPTRGDRSRGSFR